MSEVFDYVSDFDHAAAWRTEVVDSSMSPPAPMRARLSAPGGVTDRRP